MTDHAKDPRYFERALADPVVHDLVSSPMRPAWVRGVPGVDAVSILNQHEGDTDG
jgi:hypothetical protein